MTAKKAHKGHTKVACEVCGEMFDKRGINGHALSHKSAEGKNLMPMPMPPQSAKTDYAEGYRDGYRLGFNDARFNKAA